MINALLFDFDGLILDTETPEFQVWQTIYREYGHEFSIERWGQVVGGWGISDFDPANYLAELAGDGLNPEGLRARHKAKSDALTLLQPVLPGVAKYLDEALHLDLRLAIASSSPHSWVDTHLSRLGLYHHFDTVVCADDVAPGRTKPNPDLFLLALERLEIQASQAIVFEDSPNGVMAAKAAGIFVVAVPNPITARLKIDGADLTVESLANMPLQDLLNHK